MKVKVFAVELAADTAPKEIFEHASRHAGDTRGLYDLFKKHHSPHFILQTCRRLALFTVGTCPGKSIHFFEDLKIDKILLDIKGDSDYPIRKADRKSVV